MVELLIDSRGLEERLRSSLLDANAAYVGCLIEWGYFEFSELPPIAVHCYDLGRYVGAVLNGGHSAFLGNGEILKEFPGRTELSCRTALQAMGHAELLNVFEDFCTFLQTEPVRTAAAVGNWGFGPQDPILLELDRRLYRLYRSDPIEPRMAAYLLSAPGWRSVSWERWYQEIAALILSNPQRSTRKSKSPSREMLKVREGQEFKDLVAACAEVGITVAELVLAPDMSIRRNDKGMMGYHLETDRGWVLFAHDGRQLGNAWLVLGMPDRVHLFSKNW